MKTLKKLTALVLIIAALATCLIGCNKNPLTDYEIDESTEKKDFYYVAMAVKNHGIIIVELDRRYAPITVDNFVKLVREGFYDGLTFHRVIEGFMIQGGDPNADGTGGSDEKIFGEFLYNGWYNTIPHERGVISMARGDNYDSASSQFFICNASTSNVGYLDYKYAAFGHVVEGMDVVDSITSSTAKFGDNNGAIAKKNKQAVITEMKVIKYTVNDK